MEIVKNFAQSKLVKYLFLALVGSILLAISSKIKIPFYPVPMTMQTLVVLIIGIGFFPQAFATALAALGFPIFLAISLYVTIFP